MQARDLLFVAGATGLAVGCLWAVLPASVVAIPKVRRVADSSVYYSGCNEVRALGNAPLYDSDPGYRTEMDGDGDGIACETQRY
jgi:hypothetical protein